MSSERFKTEILPLRQQLFRLSMKMLGDVQDAEDAVQESLLKLWHIRDTLESYENPAAFATTVTKNICLDKIKLKKQTKTIDEYFVLIDSDNPQLQLERQDTNKLVRFIIQGLPPLQQQIITMSWYNTMFLSESMGKFSRLPNLELAKKSLTAWLVGAKQVYSP
jgi:RNA polymerase sigma-70 factor (ECF subfamily)